MACSACTLSTTTTLTPIDPSGLGAVCFNDENSQCILTMLRVWINDLNGTEFSDDRLLQILKVSAYFVFVELECCGTVRKPNVDVCVGCLDGDPFAYPGFTTLMVTKAACIVMQGLARSKAQSEGLSATCGPARLQVSSSSAGINFLVNEGPCKAYEELKKDLCFRCPLQAGSGCKQILSTFVTDGLKPGLGCNPTPYIT